MLTLQANWGKPGIVGPPESPRALYNHLWLVIALGEQSQSDLTPEPRRHDHDDLRASSVAKAECAADDLVELVDQMQLHAIVPTEHRILNQEAPILVWRRKHHDIIDLPADVIVEALCLIGRDPVFVSLVADNDCIGVAS